ncbi:MAG: hypothetical protein LC733_04870 [Actinobacteria bacterium]|nr:hypothetical protein [Actinomycetota bacterium]
MTYKAEYIFGRPNANCDPYLVTKAITETVCSALESSTWTDSPRSGGS